MGACMHTAFPIINTKRRRFTSNPLRLIESTSLTGCILLGYLFKSNFLGNDLILNQATPDWYKQDWYREELHIIYNYSGCKGYMP